MDIENIEPLTARVFAALQRTIHLHKELIGRELAKQGSHPPEVFTLHLLTTQDGMTQRDLANRLHISRPWITRLLQVMERSELVVRRADEHDQRLTRVFLTESGRKRERELRDLWAAYLDQTIGMFSEPEKLELERLLGKLNERLSEVSEKEDAQKEEAE
jgi:DNA-binding MarR family transcriptional regulator